MRTSLIVGIKADWWGLPTRLGDKVAQLIGAEKGEVVISDSTTLNLFKVLSAAVKIQAKKFPERKIIVAEKMPFQPIFILLKALSI